MGRCEDETIPYPQDVGALVASAALARAADDALEQAMQGRLTLGESLERLLPLLCLHTDARAAFVVTFDEDLARRRYVHQAGTPPCDAATFDSAVGAVEKGGATVVEGQGWTLLSQRLDVAGEDFGSAGVLLGGQPDQATRSRVRHLLDTWGEEVDGYLAALARARRKHRLTCRVSEALKDPLLDRGIAAAVRTLQDDLAFDRLLVAYQPDPGRDTSHYLVFRGGELEHASSSETDETLRALMRARGARLVQEGDDEVLRRLGIDRYRQEVLISGVHHEQVVGRVVVGQRDRAFNTFDRDLLERFADYLRQRIVDFNKEWRRLSLCFPRTAVERLLADPNHRGRYLAPREEGVAVMFADIAGFTWLSEQVLKEPQRIGALIDGWGRKAVAHIWRTGGVFDKMVGDCVIGLWGPPFFEWSARECCARALDAAVGIREMTRGLDHETELFREPLERPLGVATGINFGQLFVGEFGPNDNYTGFSAEMNNAARLQGVAARDEILCMERVVELLGADASFGPPRTARVKNVAEPLLFRAYQE